MMKFSRVAAFLLGVLLLLGAAHDSRANDDIFPPAPAAKASIDFDGRGFLINGKRTPIFSAGMEYARVPRALWRDRLLRLKRAGFNCVEMYTFWNFHEPKEGQFDFSGDHDLNAYLKLVHQMGMYAICRVGPYYCAEWDGGGYPVWLRFKPGVHVRTDDPQFIAAMDPFWDKLIPIVAANQINRGGAVVLVQLENEHLAGGGTDLPNAYFKHLQAKAVALGIQVPYFFSGLHHGGDPAGDHSWDSVGRTSPWMTTEFWSVNFDRYGAGPTDADVYERRTWKILAFGGNGYNDYMAHGGTNFGYTNNDEDAASYDYGSAVGQAGDLRPTYYRYKRINWFARSFPEIFEDSVNADADFQGAATDPTVRVTARRSSGGNAVFLDNPGNSTVMTQVKGPDGQVFPSSGPMTLTPGQIVPILEGTPLTPHITLALGATRILGTTAQGETRTLVVYGLPGDPGQLRLAAPAGAKTAGAAGAWTQSPGGFYDLTLSYPSDRPAEYHLTAGTESVRVLAMSDTLADHTWFIPIRARTAIVCGPAYVGDAAVTDGRLRLTTERGLAAPSGISPDPYAESSPTLVYGLGMDGAALTAPAPLPGSFTPPRLSRWESQPVTESAPTYVDAHWLTTEDPKPMGADGDASAYAWYRTTVHASSAGDYTLAFQSANDRIITFLDGVRVLTDMHQSTVALPLTAGDHSVAILAVHYGRAKLFGYTGPFDTVDVKGPVGPARLGVSDGPGIALTNWRMVAASDGDHTTPPAPDAPGWADVQVGDDAFHGRQGFAWFQTILPASLLTGGQGRRQVLHFESVDDNGTVFLNGTQVAQHSGWNEAFNAPLDAALADGRPVVLSVLAQNTDGAGGLDKPVTLLSYRSDAPVVGWKMRGGIEAGMSEAAWKPLAPGTALDGSPRFYRARFTATPPGAFGPHPILRVVTAPLSAGFVWLNGHNLGRYPEKIPINGLYMPECWLQNGENTLVIFDEDGKSPDGVTLTVETVASRTVTEGTALSAAAVLLPSIAHAQNPPVTPYEADASFDAYNAAFLVRSNGHAFYANSLSDRSPAFLWGQALDIVVAEDAFERTHTPARQQLVRDLVTTFLANNPGIWSWDGWNDDIAWSCIACIRGYQITGDAAFLRAAADNWNMAYSRGWDNVVGGGIWENQDKHTKNPLSNDPFIISGCALYAATGDSSYLTRSQGIYTWVHNNIFDTTTGQVNGSRTAAGILQTSDNAYDSGAFIEAANCLHQTTGDSQYYNDSLLAINHIINEGPVLHSNGEDSSNAWAYWFVKGLSDVCTDNNLWAQYYPWMLGNANTAWGMRNSANLTWNDWTNPTNIANPAALTVSSAVAVWQVLNIPAQSLIVNGNSGLAMDLIGGSPARNAVINQATPSHALDGDQRWMVVPTPNGHTAIISAATGMAATVSAGSTSSGAPLVDWPYSTGDDSQQWDLISQGGGWYGIRNVRSGLALAAPGRGAANGSRIVQGASKGVGAATRRWRLRPLVRFAGSYEIQSVSSALALAVSGGPKANAAPIVQRPYGGDSRQLWNFTPTSRGYYRIRSVSSGQVLNVTGSSVFNGAAIVQWPAGSATNDQWFPAQNSNGTYTFYNLNSGLVLNDSGGTTPGAPFDQWVTNSGTDEEFHVIPKTASGSRPRGRRPG